MNFKDFKSKYQKIPVEEYPNQVPENPIVSVCVQTYQHAPYIRECLDSILMQDTEFLYEILLGEDDSTDGTREICIEYAKRYPDRIRLFLHHRENNIEINGSPTGRFNSRYNFYSTRGKYIAICEGDDFWTDDLKLQKQAEFLEKNQDSSLCFHASRYIHYADPSMNSINKPSNIPPDLKFQVEDVIRGGGGFMATNSMFFRKKYLSQMPEWMMEAPVLDLPLMLFLGTKGNIGYINKILSAYRLYTPNSWSIKNKFSTKKKKLHTAIITLWKQFNSYTGYKYNKEINKTIRSRQINYIKSIILNYLK